MAKQVKKEQIFKFEEGKKGSFKVLSNKGGVYQGDIIDGSFVTYGVRSLDLDALNEIAEFIKGLDKGE